MPLFFIARYGNIKRYVIVEIRALLMRFFGTVEKFIRLSPNSGARLYAGA